MTRTWSEHTKTEHGFLLNDPVCRTKHPDPRRRLPDSETTSPVSMPVGPVMPGTTDPALDPLNHPENMLLIFYVCLCCPGRPSVTSLCLRHCHFIYNFSFSWWIFLVVWKNTDAHFFFWNEMYGPGRNYRATTRRLLCIAHETNWLDAMYTYLFSQIS